MYRWAEHTGELALEIEAGSEEEVFAEAVAALAELLDDAAGGAATQAAIEVRAADRPALLAEWLSELVFRAETDGLVPLRVAALELGPETLRGTVEGRLGSPPPLVKAVTYHRLTFAAAEGGWRASVVLDV